jgi:hypothetical protein
LGARPAVAAAMGAGGALLQGCARRCGAPRRRHRGSRRSAPRPRSRGPAVTCPRPTACAPSPCMCSACSHLAALFCLLLCFACALLCLRLGAELLCVTACLEDEEDEGAVALSRSSNGERGRRWGETKEGGGENTWAGKVVSPLNLTYAAYQTS